MVRIADTLGKTARQEGMVQDHKLTIVLWQHAVICDDHRHASLLCHVALPKVYLCWLEAEASGGELQPYACQHRQHLSHDCHLHKWLFTYC